MILKYLNNRNMYITDSLSKLNNENKLYTIKISEIQNKIAEITKSIDSSYDIFKLSDENDNIFRKKEVSSLKKEIEQLSNTVEINSKSILLLSDEKKEIEKCINSYTKKENDKLSVESDAKEQINTKLNICRDSCFNDPNRCLIEINEIQKILNK